MYVHSCVPLYEHSYFSGDTILETYNTSGYATVADYGKTLGDDYVAAVPSLLSPDRCVDLSTAILPEYTYMVVFVFFFLVLWFFFFGQEKGQRGKRHAQSFRASRLRDAIFRKKVLIP